MAVIQVCLLALLALPQTAPATKVDPREHLPTAISEGIRLLEAKEYLAFLKVFVPPEELAQRERREDIAAFAEKFGQKAPLLLVALKEAQQGKPVMQKEGTVASFELTAREGGPKTLRFEKIGKYWYIAN